MLDGELGEPLASEVRRAAATRERGVGLVREAEKRVRVLVCGLFYRLAGERAEAERRQKCARKKKQGKKAQKKRKRPAGLKAKRGKSREREVDGFWRAVASADVSDYSGSYFDLGPWCSVAVLPRFSDGRRWAEGGHAGEDGRVVGERAAPTFYSRRQRLGAVADAAGIDGGVMERAGLRVGKRRRVEEGGDVSGVT